MPIQQSREGGQAEGGGRSRDGKGREDKLGGGIIKTTSFYEIMSTCIVPTVSVPTDYGGGGEKRRGARPQMIIKITNRPAANRGPFHESIEENSWLLLVCFLIR